MNITPASPKDNKLDPDQAFAAIMRELSSSTRRAAAAALEVSLLMQSIKDRGSEK